MDIDTLGCSGQRGSKNLRELASSDYLEFGALIWYRSSGVTLATTNFGGGHGESLFFGHNVNQRPTRSTYRQDLTIEVHEDVGDFSDDEDLTPSKIAFYQDVIGEEILKGELLSSDKEWDSSGDEGDPFEDITLP
ncbi:hypothetical protein JHK87_024315 [Glycine soja]|nr:hypothetical protein JHK87_024315 [Glycine soja]